MRRLALLGWLVVLAALPAPAAAGWFRAEPVADGVAAVGNVDLARDGTGAVVFVRADGHVYVSRLIAGAFQAAERVDAGVPEGGSDPVVAASKGGRFAVVWRSADRVLGAFSDGGPLAAPAVLGTGAVGPPDLDMAVQGTAWATFAQAGDVHAVRLRDGAWTAPPAVLDLDPAQVAGDGGGRPRVAVGADGNGVVTWGEPAPDGRRHVIARRVIDQRISAFPQEVSPPSFENLPAGDADSPDIAIEEDTSFAWVVWREDFGGVSRTLARRLVGSLFDAPAGIGAGGAAVAPRVAMNGDGAGLAVAGVLDGTVGASLLTGDVFAAAAPSGTGTAPLPAIAEDRARAVVWQRGGQVVGRHAPRDEAFDPEVVLGDGAGAADLAADEDGNFAVAFQQADRAMVATWDEAPGEAAPRTTRSYQNDATPLLRWSAGDEAWGQLFRVVLDGVALPLVAATETSPKARLKDGSHRWWVESVDRRGQVTRSETRIVRVDTRRPSARVRVTGGRFVGATVVVRAQGSDRRSGIDGLRVDWGDGSRPTRRPGLVVTHRYTRRGTFPLVARVFDGAGNAARRSFRVRIG